MTPAESCPTAFLRRRTAGPGVCRADAGGVTARAWGGPAANCTGRAGIFAEADDCPTRRIEAFCKLLDERATYQQDRGKRGAAPAAGSVPHGPPLAPVGPQGDRLFEHEEVRAKREIAPGWAAVEGTRTGCSPT